MQRQSRSSRASSLDTGPSTVFTSSESLQAFSLRSPGNKLSPDTTQKKLSPASPEVDRTVPSTEIEENTGWGAKVGRVREVTFDERGQTWDVYGADFDPELLGKAIETHLERIMKERLTLCDQGHTECSLEVQDDSDATTAEESYPSTNSYRLLRYLCNTSV
jgi:G protein-regulated inducer of neurite outgrowth C-terminus